MLFISKKTKSLIPQNLQIIQDFLAANAQDLLRQIPSVHAAPFVLTQENLKPLKLLTYRVSQDECKKLQQQFHKRAFFQEGESKQSWFGKLKFEGYAIGLYLGAGYEYGTHWARFWVEESI